MNTPSEERLKDEELLQAYLKTGESFYFSELYRRYAKQIYRLCAIYLKDPEESRDAMMSIFEKCLIQLHSQNIRSFSDWLFCLTRNECISHLRRQERRERLQREFFNHIDPDAILHPEKKGIFAAAKGITPYDLHQAPKNLRTEQRSCIELYYFEQKSYREIAVEMGCSLKSVKSFLQNGRRQLKKLLQQSPG